MSPLSVEEEVRPGRATGTIPVRVMVARWESERVTSYELVATDGTELPAWEPGAHLDLHLPSGTIRQYSLCGDPEDRSHYRVAVLHVVDGRGGSAEVHRELRPGAELEIGCPRADFQLSDAPQYVFVAGGIGITPLLPMIREVRRRRLPWELVYGARSAQHFTFAAELEGLGGELGKPRFVAQDTDGHIDLAAVAKDSTGAAVYTCGPAAMMDALAEQMAVVGRADDLHLERFSAAPVPAGEELGDTFEVELASSGQVITVGPDETVLEAVRSAGVEHLSSCEMGICGTCETRVLSGAIDHRDDLLTDQEREAGDTMMICVSRARCPRLVLDL